MCRGGGDSRRQEQLSRDSMAQQQAQFDESQEFSQNQFLWQQGEAHLAQETERLRQEKIFGAMDDINSAFSKRDGIFTNLENSTYTLNKNALNKNRDTGRRDLAFALSRAGRRFDSLDVDKSDEVQDRYNKGILDAKTFATNTSAGARSADQSIKQGLLSSAATGLFDGNDLVSSARGSLNAVSNASGGVAPSLQGDNYFTDIANSIGQFAGLYGMQQGNKSGQQYYSNVPAGSSSGGSISNRGLT